MFLPNNLAIDIVDRCQPLAGAVDPTFGLSNYTICQQQDNGVLRDGFRSFPSGHSSCEVAAMFPRARYSHLG